jgi:hypothetical protein
MTTRDTAIQQRADEMLAAHAGGFVAARDEALRLATEGREEGVRAMQLFYNAVARRLEAMLTEACVARFAKHAPDCPFQYLRPCTCGAEGK